MGDVRGNLKRTITLMPLIGIEVGQSIGAGIFALTGLALSYTGPSLPLAFVAAGVLVSLAMAVLAMVSSGHPVSGGTYFYGSRFFSPVAAFTGVWAYVLGAVLGMFPLFALTGARFLQWVFPALPLMPTALALLVFFYLTNLFGVKLAMWVQAVMVGVLFVALFVFLGAGLPRVDLLSFQPLFTGGVGGFAVASAILTFTVLGANAAVELGDEIVAPERTIPRSFLVSIPVVTAIYVAIAVVVAGAGPWTGKADEALTGIAATFLSRPLFLFFIFGGGFLAVVTTLNATYLWGTRSLLLIAEDGLLPRGLAAVNRRFGTPHWLLTAIAALSCVSLYVAGDSVETFAIFASLGGIIIFIPVMIAALRLRRHFPDVYQRSTVRLRGAMYWIAPIGGLVLCLLVVAILVVDLLSRERAVLYLGVFIGWLVLGAAWAWLRRRHLAGRGRSLQDMSRGSTK
ncbi:MAG TPA: APC family permease [Desulfobacterales bacterium]|nr:APC family permease [Desulfobacterales bacterium]